MFLNGLRTVARLMKNNTIIICASCVKGYRETVPQLCVRKELSNDAIPLICTFKADRFNSRYIEHRCFHHTNVTKKAYELLTYHFRLLNHSVTNALHVTQLPELYTFLTNYFMPLGALQTS